MRRASPGRDLAASLAAFEGARVAVIGDVMLDCYISGRVERISPEAPVPVLRVASQRIVPGGAANVAANLAALGLHVRLVGLVGEDEARLDLLGALAGHGEVDSSGLIATTERQTIHKLRIIGEHQQIVRVDRETIGPIGAALEERCIAAARAAIEDCDVAVVSDYGKGVCSDAVLRAVLDGAGALGRPIVVDPKRRDLGAYRGATILTPNRKELADATGLACDTDEEATLAASRAGEATGAAVLLTRSEKGMSFFPYRGAPVHLATVAQDVFDVSGAGDTVVAVLSAAVAAGLDIVEALRLANHGAGIVVSKLGTATVSRDELAIAMAADEVAAGAAEGRLLTLREAVVQRAAWARERLTVGFANGCFDLLHPGHVALIDQAAAQCDRLIVALNTDASVRRLKGASRPVQDERARAQVMGALRGVSAVILFDQDTPLEAITALGPDLLVKGADYRVDEVVGADAVRARGGRVLLADLSPGRSTSSLIGAMTTPRSQAVH